MYAMPVFVRTAVVVRRKKRDAKGMYGTHLLEEPVELLPAHPDLDGLIHQAGGHHDTVEFAEHLPGDLGGRCYRRGHGS